MSASFAGKRFGDPGGCPRARCPQPPEARHAPPARRRRRGRAGWARRARVARRLRERNKDHDPRPIPGGFDGNFDPVPADPSVHVLPPAVGFEMSTITDFDGVVGAAEIQGTASKIKAASLQLRLRHAGHGGPLHRHQPSVCARGSSASSESTSSRGPTGSRGAGERSARLRARDQAVWPLLDDPDLEARPSMSSGTRGRLGSGHTSSRSPTSATSSTRSRRRPIRHRSPRR